MAHCHRPTPRPRAAACRPRETCGRTRAPATLRRGPRGRSRIRLRPLVVAARGSGRRLSCDRSCKRHACRRRAGAPVDRFRKRHRWRWRWRRRRRCFGPLSFDFLIFSLLEILFRFPLALLGAGFAHPHFILFFGAHHFGTRATATNSAVTVPATRPPSAPLRTRAGGIAHLGRAFWLTSDTRERLRGCPNGPAC